MTAATMKGRIVPLIVAAAFLMQQLDGALINTSLPQIAASFGVAPERLSIGVSAYVLSLAVFVPLAGWLADRFGPRSVFVGAIAVFTIASVLCGLANDLVSFTAARALQGVGGALMTPVGRIVVLRATSNEQLLRTTAMITWPALVAPVAGPVIGGLITGTIGWRWNFLLNVPPGLIGMILALRYLPAERTEVPRPLDGLGFVLAALGLSGLVFGFEGLGHGAGDRLIWAGVVLAGGVSGLAAVAHFRRTLHPLLDLATLRIGSFVTTSVGSGTVFRVAVAATHFLLPLLFQTVFGLTPLEAGGLVLVYFLGNLAIKPATSPLLRRFGFRTVLVVNGVINALAIAGLGLLAPTTPMAALWALLFVAGLARSLQFTALTTLAFADVAEDKRGSAATLMSMFSQIGICIGVSAAAMLLDVARSFQNAPRLALADFQIAFGVMALIALAAVAGFARLDAQAGWAVSGARRCG